MARSTFAVFPSYIMQTVKLPKVIRTKIDRIYRQFIWGSAKHKKRIHLITWDKVCKPKQEGGLGFRKAKEINLACMTKLAWEMVNNPKKVVD